MLLKESLVLDYMCLNDFFFLSCLVILILGNKEKYILWYISFILFSCYVIKIRKIFYIDIYKYIYSLLMILELFFYKCLKFEIYF